MPATINWTPELETEICDWIASGKTLRAFCRQDGKPSHDAVYDRQKTNQEFKQHIADARESGEDVIAEECLEIADDGSNDYSEQDLGDGVVVQRVNQEHIQRSRLRVDTRLKLLAKWNPKKYGDKLAHTGASGDGPIELIVKHIGSDGE
jgi:hypothetical protein